MRVRTHCVWPHIVHDYPSASSIAVCLSPSCWQGLGSQLQLRFGGKTSHMAGDPIDALITVEGLTDYCQYASGWRRYSFPPS